MPLDTDGKRALRLLTEELRARMFAMALLSGPAQPLTWVWCLAHRLLGTMGWAASLQSPWSSPLSPTCARGLVTFPGVSAPKSPPGPALSRGGSVCPEPVLGAQSGRVAWGC